MATLIVCYFILGGDEVDVSIDIADAKIETDRLILRAWQETDLDDFFEYASVEGVGEMAGWEHHDSIDVSHGILMSFISKKNEFSIVLKESNKVIGSLGLHDSWANDEIDYEHLIMKEIGYVLSKDYWGQGLTPEAVKAIIDHCFVVYRLEALTSGHSLSNSQSKRVLEKCGFKYVKTRGHISESTGFHYHGMKYILFKPKEE